MKRKVFILAETVFCIGLTVALNGCGGTQAKGDTGDTGPRPASVEADVNPENFKVDHPERFPLVSRASSNAKTPPPHSGLPRSSSSPRTRSAHARRG